MEKKILRLNRLLVLLRKQKIVSTKEVAEHLGVSAMTVRRDLDELEKSHLVERSYGKAVLMEGNCGIERFQSIEYEYALSTESAKRLEEKKRIGRYAARLIQPDDVVILDNGSTINLLADYIPTGLNLTIGCYNYNLLEKFWHRENIQIIFSGGYFHRSDQMFESAQGVDFLQSIRANKVFLSASGIHQRLGMTCAHTYEVSVKQAILQSALQRILVADSSKFGTIKTVFFSQITEVDTIITDDGLSREWAEAIHAKGIDLHIV